MESLKARITHLLCNLNLHKWQPIAGTEWITSTRGYSDMVTHAHGRCARCGKEAGIELREW